MKKILTAIVLFAFVVLPMSVMAMTTITDNELSSVTGQAGVSINVDVTAHVEVGTLAWGDSNGFTGYTNMGFVGIEGLDLMVTAAGRTDGPFMTTAANDVGYLRNAPITIDVGTNTSGATLVRIGLPTLHITVSDLDMNIFVSGGALATGPTSTAAQQLGAVYISGVDIKMGMATDTSDASTYNAGFVTIGAAGAGNVGVNIGFAAFIDSVELGTVSYGNTTSILAGTFGAAATAGYVGVQNLVINDISVVGGVAIGIGTLNGTALGAAAFGTPTMVNIIFANGTYIDIPNAIYGSVLLASDKELSTNVGTLGNFYIGGVTATILDNDLDGGGPGSTGLSAHSVIQIWAH